MDPFVLGMLGLGAMLFLVSLRVPIAFGMAIVGFVGLIFAVGWPEGEEFDFDRGFEAAFAYAALEPFSFIASFPIVGTAVSIDGLCGLPCRFHPRYL